MAKEYIETIHEEGLSLHFEDIQDGSWDSTRSESARWTSVTLEHFEKLKMASKMAAILVFQS